MGNANSGRWRDHTKMRLIEDSYYLDVNQITGVHELYKTREMMVPILISPGTIVTRADVKLAYWQRSKALMTFSLRIAGEKVDFEIACAALSDSTRRSQPMFLCPSSDCQRSCRRLYLPPGEQRFLCQACHKLTYRKRQTHDARLSELVNDPDQFFALWEKFPDRKKLNSSAEGRLLMRAGSLIFEKILAEAPPVIQEFFVWLYCGRYLCAEAKKSPGDQKLQETINQIRDYLARILRTDEGMLLWPALFGFEP